MYGKRQVKYAPLLSGLGLCAYSYFIDSWVWLCVVGIVLAVVPFVVDFSTLKPCRTATHRKVQATIISVKVKPNSRVSALVQGEDGAWLAQLKSPPVDGRRTKNW